MNLDPMCPDDINDAADLVAAAMNANEGAWARDTMNHHFTCANNGINDGRTFYIWRENNQLCGLVGLHHYAWGPRTNVWLSWFAVAPHLQGAGNGKQLLDAIERIAIQNGYEKLFVETYAHDDFKKARRFYTLQGFAEVGFVRNYLDDGSDMIVYSKGLTPH